MAPDWRHLLRWLKPGRPPAESEGIAPPEAAPDKPPARQDTVTPPLPAAHPSPGTAKGGSRSNKLERESRPAVNRNGIPVLRPGDDLDRLLLETEEIESEPGTRRAPEMAACSGGDFSAKKTTGRRSASPGRQAQAPRNRHGLPLLSDQGDLHDHFHAAADTPSPSGERHADRPHRPGDCRRRDKNGILVLDDCQDLGRLLEAVPAASPGEDDLADAFEQSLAHDARTLIKKKTDGFFPTRRLTLKERLKRYPKPQGQLDLHGATVLQAEQRTDSYIRTAHVEGTLTLRIIVGKGLHSEAGAVLPDVVEDRLLRLKRDGLVLSYRWEKGLKRKSGAVIVYLEAPF
ncbi:MAG: Smr/MutS family protein [Deltaproteobacteria bacterium]|nr:Smr/MutS family protein [Deltaproteobacteria bacterium]